MFYLRIYGGNILFCVSYPTDILQTQRRLQIIGRCPWHKCSQMISGQQDINRNSQGPEMLKKMPQNWHNRETICWVGLLSEAIN